MTALKCFACASHPTLRTRNVESLDRHYREVHPDVGLLDDATLILMGARVGPFSRWSWSCSDCGRGLGFVERANVCLAIQYHTCTPGKDQVPVKYP